MLINPVMHRHVQISILAASAICMTFLGCTRHVYVEKEMTWECAPEEYKPAYYARPDEYVRFRFVEDPHFFEVESSKNLCVELRETGKRVVTARFEVWGGRFLAAQGYRIVAVEEKPMVNVGGWGNSGANEPTGTSPIGKIIEELK